MRDVSYISGLFASIEYDGELSATAYIILAVVLLGIIMGLGWCFYRAITTTNKSVEIQSPDEIDDEI
jgi:hypothetical protein